MHRSALFTDDSGGIADALLLLLLACCCTRREHGGRPTAGGFPSLNADFRSSARMSASIAVNCTRCKREHQRRRGLHEDCTRAIFVKKCSAGNMELKRGMGGGGQKK